LYGQRMLSILCPASSLEFLTADFPSVQILMQMPIGSVIAFPYSSS